MVVGYEASDGSGTKMYVVRLAAAHEEHSANMNPLG